MAAPMKRVVSWIDRSEWVQVYDELYSGKPSKQKHALDRIAVWKCRAQNKLSTAIECTWELTSAELHHHWATEESSLAEQDKQLRILYAMALTRFINLITEKGQNARYAFPVHQLANDLCLPQWMVSLRHDSVHSNLPSLAILKAGVQTALAWLKVEYWEAQLEEEDPDFEDKLYSQPEVPDSETAEMMAQMLETYTAEYHCRLTEGDGGLSNADREQLWPIIKDIEKLVARSNREVALSVLLQEGFMLHTQEQLEALGVNIEEFLSDSSLRLPAELLAVWCPLVKSLYRVRAVSQLLRQLLSQDPAASDLRLRQATGWALEILIAASPDQDDQPAPLLSKVFAGDPSFTKGRRLLMTCLENPNRYTTAILPYLFKSTTPPLSPVQEKLLKRTVKIYTKPRSSTKNTVADDTDEIHDVDSLDIVAKPMEWSDCPLGFCPEAPVTYTNLELPESVNSLGSASHDCSTPMVQPPSVPSRVKNSKQHTGKNNSKSLSEDNKFEPSHISLEWSASELNSIKEKVSLF